MTLEQMLSTITPANEQFRQEAHGRQNDMAKPLGSLGLLENAIDMLAGAQHTANVHIDKRAVIVFCADNGIVKQGVTQCGQEVTAVVTENLSRGDTTVCIMAEKAGVTVIPVDIGVARPVTGEKIRQLNLMRGTDDMTQGPAMSREMCIRAIETGIALVRECQQEGYQLLATGEMGIGNTTTSSAVASVLLQEDPEVMTGRGAGLSSAGLQRKVKAIQTAIERNHPDQNDPIDVISKVGGLDIAGMVGMYLGGAIYHIPIIMDGFISTVAALAALRICPAIRGYMMASHVSAEPAGRRILTELDMKPLICADMRLGEGTGAVAGIALLDLVLEVYHHMVCFNDIQIEHYVPLS